MKKLFLVGLFLFAFVLTMSAGTRSPVLAQNGAAATQQAPADNKGTPSEPERAPAPAKAESRKQSHKNFFGMDLKECSGCHAGAGVAPNHGAFWEREHRVAASKSSKNCAECHSQQSCLDCHSGGGIDANLDKTTIGPNYVPKSHRTDFREIHPIKALDNPQTCNRCHDQKFCSSCHSKFRGEDLMVQSHRRAWSDLTTMPLGPAHSTFTTAQCQTCHPGGLLPKHVWSAEHGREARRNLQACQTCHSDGEICMTCHSARQGLMVNPHPRSWNKSGYRSKSDGRTCIKCHDNY